MKLKQYITESSLSRLWRYNENFECAAITAFRKARDCGEGNPYTKKEKEARNKSLAIKLKSKGYQVTQIKGKYPEGSGKVIKETGFFVVNNVKNNSFFDDVKKIGEYFEQDSVLLIPKESIQNKAKAYLVGVNNCKNNQIKYGEKYYFNLSKMGYESPIYTSYVNGRPFIFEEIGEDIYTPGDGFGWWHLHLLAEKKWEDLVEL